MKTFICIILLGIFVGSMATLPLPTKPITNIAFGSCNAHTYNQSVWKGIIHSKPDLWVWLGDVIYADTPLFPLISTTTPLNEMRAKYETMKNSELYQKLLQTSPVVGVWDDHDYGLNNGGSEYRDKVPSQQLFLDFIDEPAESPRREQSGVYTSYYLPGDKSDTDIKLILLDTRFNKIGMMGAGDMLGEHQWEWLENELATSKARFHIIGSSIQVTPFQKPIQESWSSHPESRQRLFNLISKHRVPGAFFISGDVHYSEILRIPANCSGTGYPIYEFTSSGLTHTCDGMIAICKPILNHLFVTPFHYNNSFWTKINWGSIHFDWKNQVITFKTHDVHGDVVFSADIPFDSILTLNQGPVQQERLTICEGEPSYLLLIPFESWKYFLFLIPITFIIVMARWIYYCTCYRRAKPVSDTKKNQ